MDSGGIEARPFGAASHHRLDRNCVIPAGMPRRVKLGEAR
jgi:hypothetical protein